MKTENVSTLKIHKLTQAQYDRELAAGNIDENALYLTPEEVITPESIGAAASDHTHSSLKYSDSTDAQVLFRDTSDTAYFRPNNDVYTNCGSTSYRWKNVYTDKVNASGQLYTETSVYAKNFIQSDTNVYAKGNITADGLIVAGTRVYIGNTCGFRGMNYGETSPAINKSQCIGWVNADNNVILGDQENNTGHTIMRCPSGKSLYLQTNGVVSNTGSSGCIQYTYLQDSSAYFFRPTYDGLTRMGSSSYKWGQIYSSKETISTSDRNLKKNIEDLDDRYIELFDLVRPVSYQLIDGDRIHTGFISQEVEEAMKKVGLAAEECGFFCKDIKTVIQDKDGEDIPILDEEGNPVYIYSLRYSEYIAIMAEKVRRLEAKHNEELEELRLKLAELEAKLA